MSTGGRGVDSSRLHPHILQHAKTKKKKRKEEDVIYPAHASPTAKIARPDEMGRLTYLSEN